MKYHKIVDQKEITVWFWGGKWKKASIYITPLGEFPQTPIAEFKGLSCLEVIEKLRQDKRISIFEQEIWNHLSW